MLEIRPVIRKSWRHAHDDIPQGRNMAKAVDRKKQERVTFDTLLESIVQEGKIYAGALKKTWKSIQPYFNQKRMEYFLRKNGILIAPKAVQHIGKFDKNFPKAISPELIAV